jgi:Zinc carboxypeptidase
MKKHIALIAILTAFLAAGHRGTAQSPSGPTQSAPDASATPQKALAFTSSEKITVPLRFDRYYTYEQVGEALRALHEAYPGLTAIDVVGKSEEGREIWAMTVNNPKTGAALSKPGVYVDGNIHGNEIQAAEVALAFLNRLLVLYGSNSQITELVDQNAFYVIPVVNVDGRYHFFHDANTPSSNRSIRIPKDDDHDGLVDEDGPDDLDGDGNICTMRKRDPFGRYKTDPEEPRLMVPLKPGDKAEWTLLGDEGIDNDGDGQINEDEEGYVDGNRNWGFRWFPPYVQSGAGDFPFEASGLRAIAKYIMDRPNIIVVFAFHNSGGMYLRGPTAKSEEPMNPSDVAVYDILGKNAEKIVPGYRYLVSWKDLYTTNGDFADFTENLAGAYSFVGELFVSEAEMYRGPDEKPQSPGGMDLMGNNPAQERERLKFSDNVVQGELYKPWKPFKHPQYGDIEIGGWVKMSSRLPHPFMLNDLVFRNASVVLFAAAQTPKISMDVFSIEKIGDALYRVRVRLANAHTIPSMSYGAVQKNLYPRDMLKVSGQGIKVIAGGALLDAYLDRVEYKAYRPELQMLQVPGSGKAEFQFLLSGKGSVTFDYTSRKAGKLTRTVELKPIP